MGNNNIVEEIKKASDSILTSKIRISPQVMEKVSDILIDKLFMKPIPRLCDDDVKSIGKALTIANNPRSYQTWLHLDCFNQLIFELKKNGVIESPYFNIPQQIERHLIFQMEDDLLEDIQYIQILQNDLLNLKVTQSTDLKSEEIENICSFIAAVAIFGKILFPKFHLSLLTLKVRDIGISPDYINIPIANSDVFYRYFLPFPASVYLFRCILFYKKNHKKLGIKKINNPDNQIFQPVHYDVKDISSIFKEWTAKRLQENGVTDAQGMKISSFRKAVIKSSVISNSAADGKDIVSCPPFIIAIQSREIESFSFGNKHLVSFLGKHRYKANYYDNLKQKIHVDNQHKTKLKLTIEEIKNIRRSILDKKPCTLEDRLIAAEDIKSKVLLKETELNPIDYENLKLYAEWVYSLLREKRFNIKTVNDYASDTQSLLYKLSEEGLIINKLDTDSLTDIIATTMSHYTSRGIKSALKSFTEFLGTYLGNGFKVPDWQRSKELHKKDIPTPKPLIDFDNHAKAVVKCRDFFTEYLNRYRNPQIKAEERKRAEHKAEIMGHMMCLSFYAGLRVSEIVNIRISDVIFDGEFVLCVRISKTKNGIRNIPLNIIVPYSYLQKFIVYLKKRKASANGNELLFPQYDGRKWDTSHISSEVERLYESIGMKDIRFHHQRHSFANWFLLKWFVAFHKDKVPDNLPFLENELFNENCISKLKKLMLGMNNQKQGQDKFTYALAVLARLMGHGGPIVTMEKYIHNADWLFYLLSKGDENKTIIISSKQAENLLQLSYPTLPNDLKGRGKKAIKQSNLLKHQRSLLENILPI